MTSKNRISILSMAVIIGFAVGFTQAVRHVIANRYISYGMFRLIAFSFQGYLRPAPLSILITP